MTHAMWRTKAILQAYRGKLGRSSSRWDSRFSKHLKIIHVSSSRSRFEKAVQKSRMGVQFAIDSLPRGVNPWLETISIKFVLAGLNISVKWKVWQRVVCSCIGLKHIKAFSGVTRNWMTLAFDGSRVDKIRDWKSCFNTSYGSTFVAADTLVACCSKGVCKVWVNFHTRERTLLSIDIWAHFQ